MMTAPSTGRVRQSAVRIFAQEYSEASLVEQGVGEYAPSFVVPKLGARVNRCLVGGVIDRLERRDADSGPYYSGQIRDPSGAHYFNVAAFQPELHPDVEELLARFESGDRFLLAMVGRARWSENEDGGVFTSIRAEGFAVIEQDAYKSWLVEASDATLRRLSAYEASIGCELERSALSDAGVPEDLIRGLVSSRNHYQEFDTEAYRVWVLKALSTASGRAESIEEFASEPVETDTESPAEVAVEGSDPSQVILRALSSASGTLVEYDALVGACTSSGSSREEAEDAIEDLRDNRGEIIEPRFGFFQLIGE